MLSENNANLTAAIVGIGRSGTRFLRACLTVDPKYGRLHIRSIADRDVAKLAGLSNAGIVLSADYRSILDGTYVDLIIIATNDVEHAAILRHAKIRHRNFGRILCEKPLVATRSEAEALTPIMAVDDVAVHFVERYSPAVESLRTFIRERGRQVVRANFIWGRYRLKDPRPTIGIASQLSHPIDLALFLADVAPGSPYAVHTSASVESDFPRRGSVLPDSVHIAVSFGSGFVLTGSSSYVWPRRDRRMELLLADEKGAVKELAVLVLDEPLWDCDALTVFDVTREGGRPVLIHEIKRDQSDLAPERVTVHKTCRFIETVLSELGGVKADTVARFDQGVYVQEILDEVYRFSRAVRVPFRGFIEAARYNDANMDRNIDLVLRKLRGERIHDSEYMWDDGY